MNSLILQAPAVRTDLTCTVCGTQHSLVAKDVAQALLLSLPLAIVATLANRKAPVTMDMLMGCRECGTRTVDFVKAEQAPLDVELPWCVMGSRPAGQEVWVV